MLLILGFLLLFTNSQACGPGMDLFYCTMCQPTLVMTHCPYHSACSKCVSTMVEYPKYDGCLSARIICPDFNQTTYVRINHVGGGLPLEIKHSELKMFNCSSTGWRYTHKKREYMVAGATCFVTPESRQQSPIDIRTDEVTFDSNLRPAEFDFSYVIGDANRMHISPDGHGFQIYMKENPWDVMSTITASHLDGVYQPFNLHAHWSDPQNRTHLGSEHLLFGLKKAAEIHLVSWDPKYGSYAAAIGKPDGIAVFGIMVEVGAANEEFGKITDAIKEHLPITLPTEVEENQLHNIDLSDLLPENKEYFTYTGSLTTPGYAPCVIWTVFKNPITISEDQLAILLSLYNKGNDRRPQDVSSPIVSSFVP